MPKVRYGNCLHCHREGVRILTTGICRLCHSVLEVRIQYLPSAKPVKEVKGPGRSRIRRKEPVPTSALPGTEEKVRILIERAMRDEELWHPDDA